jgi:hypothetical protein
LLYISIGVGSVGDGVGDSVGGSDGGSGGGYWYIGGLSNVEC